MEKLSIRKGDIRKTSSSFASVMTVLLIALMFKLTINALFTFPNLSSPISGIKEFRETLLIDLKVHRQICKNGVSKSVALIIKHVNFQLSRVHPDGVV